jgi:transcriptional regulator GlxA family with amidase domain
MFGVAVATEALGGLAARRIGTLLIAGGEAAALRAVIAAPQVRRFIPPSAARAERFGSVCSGAFVLAELGLLDGKRVATHWRGCDRLAAMYPKLIVDADALYVVDGRVWTSAGVTTGIDMALAMVERDVGAETANAIAHQLVLYARRPGYQSQFSPLLQAQACLDSPFAELTNWMQRHLDQDLAVPTLAARAGLSVRSFHRKFTEATGETPAHFVEVMRLDAARALLGGDLPLKAIATRIGFGSAPRLSAAFTRRFGVPPKLFRQMHQHSPHRPKPDSASSATWATNTRSAKKLIVKTRPRNRTSSVKV